MTSVAIAIIISTVLVVLLPPPPPLTHEQRLIESLIENRALPLVSPKDAGYVPRGRL